MEVWARSIQQFSCTYGFIQIQSNIICRTGNGAGAWWELLVLLSRLFGHQLFPSKCSRLYGLDLNSAVTCTDCFPCMLLWVILTFKFLLSTEIMHRFRFMDISAGTWNTLYWRGFFLRESGKPPVVMLLMWFRETRPVWIHYCGKH